MSIIGKQISDFIVTRCIAESGCASIYEAYRNGQSGQKVAIKIAHSDGVFRGIRDRRAASSASLSGNREVFYDLIRREAAYLSQLRHPGIVRIFPLMADNNPNRMVYDAKAHRIPDAPSYFVMEYLPYKPLSYYMKKIQKECPLEWRMELFYQILIVVDYIHQQNIAHCDLKPDNIMLRYEPKPTEIPQIVMVDFGTASEAEQLTNEPALSLPYTSPEVVALFYAPDMVKRDQIYPDLMDVWSLGVIFFELMTGENIIPDREKDHKEIATTILRRTLRPISEIRPDLPDVEKLSYYQNMMLRKNANERPHVSGLIEALDKYISPPPRILYDDKSSGGFWRR